MKYIFFKNGACIQVSHETSEMIVNNISSNPDALFIILKSMEDDFKTLIKVSEIVSITSDAPAQVN